jgi:predicted ATPase
MIRMFEAGNYRMLASNRLHLSRFHVLVGQNATGKSTLLDAIQFVADAVKLGVREAVRRRSPSFLDLCFDRGKPVAFGVEVDLADEESRPVRMRYELEVGLDERNGGALRVLREFLFRKSSADTSDRQQSLFGPDSSVPEIHEKTPKGWRRVVNKTTEGNDYFHDERTDWNSQFRFGPDRPALGSLPEMPERFPLSIAVRDLLREDVRTLALDVERLRQPSPTGGAPRMDLDGGYLPYVVRDLAVRDPVLFGEWVEHVRLAVPGLRDVTVREREEDRFLILEAKFDGNHADAVPSWLLSDGTLRLMALTLLNFAAPPGAKDVLLIEEPENGMHPLAIQAVFNALAHPAHEQQVLCATHSPVLLAQLDLRHTLVHRRNPAGYAAIQRGDEVPELANWSGRINVADLFAAGVLS